GNITFACPGTMTLHAAEHLFEPGIVKPYSAFDSPEAMIAPVLAAMPTPDHRLQSTFALDQLTTLANTTTQAEFVLMLVPIFGFDIPAHTYIKLHSALREGSIENPEIQVTDAAIYPADYDNDTRTIRVRPSAINLAVQNLEAARHLLAVLLHEFGHHIDNLLRTDLADKNVDDTSTLAPDGHLDEGARYAYRIAFFDIANTGEAVYADYQSPTYRGPLKVDYQDAYEAIKDSQGGTAQNIELKDGSREGFGAGRGEHHKTRPDSSFGHESVEDALKNAGFNELQRKAIYFGNWLRDYSQLLDPKIVRAPDEPKNFPYKFSRRTLTKLVNLLAVKEFHALIKDQPKAARSKDFVDENMLLVYRPVEHIDNPKNINPDPADPQTVDPQFDLWVLPGDPKLEVLPNQSVKRYILDSSVYMQHKLQDALRSGATQEGMRYFGEGLHVLEDYFAHSNFVELSLRKLGYDSVLPWTAEAECRHRWPVVTGMFGSFDVIASLAEPLAQILFPIDDWEFKATSPRVYSDAEEMMLILLEDHENPELLESFKNFLELRDKWASIPGHQYVERIGWMASSPMRLIVNAHNLIFQTLLQQLGDSVDDGQTLWADNPNNSESTDPSHSQLAKDHDTHPFHSLASRLAAYAIEQVGHSMANQWSSREGPAPDKLAAGFICHPEDSAWQDKIVAAWAKANPEKIRQGQSATTLEHLHREYVANTMRRIEQIGKHGETGWNYIQENYHSLFEEKNQVQP
ncbi:Het-C domain-containing protein, partial [Pseudomonas putida]|uniref:HET-C-related protein n=1 Tax=Pseudomonas putida TaxID=303 RepID=UPI0023633B2B